MVSASGRYVIAYNGEIYNYLDLRTELERALVLNPQSEPARKLLADIR